jgi:hypothetical protein
MPAPLIADVLPEPLPAPTVPVFVVRRAKTTWHIVRVLCRQTKPPRSAIESTDVDQRAASAQSLTSATTTAEALAREVCGMAVIPADRRAWEVRCPDHGLFRINTSETYALESSVEHWVECHHQPSSQPVAAEV